MYPSRLRGASACGPRTPTAPDIPVAGAISDVQGGLTGIAFGPGPPETVLPPGSFRPVIVAPGDAGSHYDLVTASDRCGEGTAGRSSDGRRRPLPNGSCGAVP